MKAAKERIRNKFFNECTDKSPGLGNINYKVVNMAAHDLFEWIWKEMASEIEQEKRKAYPDKKINEDTTCCGKCGTII